MIVTGSIADGGDEALEATIDAARAEDKGVVIILAHHGSRVVAEFEDEEPAETQSPAEPAASLQALASAVARALSQRQDMLVLIDRLSPTSEVLPAPAVLQARRNAEARRALLEEYGDLTAAGVSELAGSSAHNRSALATRWRKEGRIFAVSHQGALRYPVFQFGADGRPLPVVNQALRVFTEAGMSEWEIALWFTTRTGWLGDRRPVDLLEQDPEAVREAALRELDPVSG